MKQTCPSCNTSVEIDEREYKPGEKVIIECPLCSEKIEFHIPEAEVKKEVRVEEKIVIKEVESEESKELKKKAAELKKKEEELKRKNEELAREKANIKKVKASDQDDKSNKGVIWIIVIVAAIALIVGGIFYYNNVLVPKKRDAAAPRYYTIATSVNLRSSRSAGGDYNKIESLPYGTELITYEVGTEWLTVKTERSDAEGEQQEGYVSAMHALDKHDFFILNSIWGDVESKEIINTTKCRKALLNYFKEHNYIGVISPDERESAGITTVPNSSNQWQVFSKAKGSSSNTTYFKKLVNKESKFTDFAVIIKNINTGERRLLYFTFNDDETPVLFREFRVPDQGYIRKMKLSLTYDFEIDFTDDRQ